MFIRIRVKKEKILPQLIFNIFMKSKIYYFKSGAEVLNSSPNDEIL